MHNRITTNTKARRVYAQLLEELGDDIQWDDIHREEQRLLVAFYLAATDDREGYIIEAIAETGCWRFLDPAKKWNKEYYRGRMRRIETLLTEYFGKAIQKHMNNVSDGTGIYWHEG